MTQTTLSDFAADLEAVQADSQLEWAAVSSATVATREQAFSDVEPPDEDARDEGLLVEYELASGRRIEDWYAKPTEWDMVTNNLVLLLEYWNLDPVDMERLDGDEEVYEVPVTHDNAIGDFRVDFRQVERTIEARSQGEDDGGTD